MRAVHLVRHAAATLIVAALLSCSGATEPRGIHGAFALVRVAGDALPAVSFESEWARFTLVADTLRFNADGTGTSVQVQRYEPLPSGAEEQSRFETAFTYEVHGLRVDIAYVCPINASCVAPPHLTGVLTGNGIRFDYVLNTRVPQDFTILEGQ